MGFHVSLGECIPSISVVTYSDERQLERNHKGHLEVI